MMCPVFVFLKTHINMFNVCFWYTLGFTVPKSLCQQHFHDPMKRQNFDDVLGQIFNSFYFESVFTLLSFHSGCCV